MFVLRARIMQVVSVVNGVFTIGVVTSLAKQIAPLTCHCSDGSNCDIENGFCPSGCQNGWSGPGCQIEDNIANKNANVVHTSSIHCFQGDDVYDRTVPNGECSLGPMAAIDGVVPSTSTQFNCSRTEQQFHPYWKLVLHRHYVIETVTVFSHPGNRSYPLHSFLVVIEDGPEDVAEAYQPGILRGNKTFRFYHIRGDAVRIEGNSTAPQELVLCEVMVKAYIYQDCSKDFTGPGCLLYNCDSPGCTAETGTCSENGYCSLSRCPMDKHWPRECWIKMPDLSNSHMGILKEKEFLKVSLIRLQNADSNLKITSIHLKVQETWSGNVLETRKFNNSQFLEARITVMHGNSYTVAWVPEVCTKGICHIGPAVSQEVTLLACVRHIPAVGCLLHGCRSGRCLEKQGTCTAKNYCGFPACPENKHWPPECLIRMPDLSQSEVSISLNKEFMHVSLFHVPTYGFSLNITSVIIEVRDNSTGILHQTLSIDKSESNSYTATVLAFPGDTYKLTWIPKVCIEDVCYNGEMFPWISTIPRSRQSMMLLLLLILPFTVVVTFILYKLSKRFQRPSKTIRQKISSDSIDSALSNL